MAPADELSEAARRFESTTADRAASRSLKDLLAPAVEVLRDLAQLADPTPRYVPGPTGSRRRKLMDQVRATVTSGLAPAVRAVLEQQARFNEQIVAALLDVVRRLQESQGHRERDGDGGSGSDASLRAQAEKLERRIAAMERARPAKKRS